MSFFLLLPPVAFILIFIVMGLQLWFFARLAAKSGKATSGKLKSYACGEDVPSVNVRPEYGQFFQFAFFFTIMHVVALVVATAPAGYMRSSFMAVFYIIAALIALTILYRRS
ncbi:MAG: hypothetical protein V2A78_06075 [bacterium]